MELSLTPMETCPRSRPRKFLHAFANFLAQVEHAVRILEQQFAGIGEGFGSRAANE